MRTFWYGSIFVIVGSLVSFVPWRFGIYSDSWEWWAIVIPLDVLSCICIIWRDSKIKEEALKEFNNGK